MTDHDHDHGRNTSRSAVLRECIIHTDPTLPSTALTFTVGHDELVIRHRYEALSMVNDILIGLWFTLGSVLFFADSTTYAGTWLFVAGSVELLIRPVIRLSRTLHLRRLPSRGPGVPTDSSQDL